MGRYSPVAAHTANWLERRDGLGLGDKQDTKFSKLSGGQRQRLSVALALVGNPEIAILDELTTCLAPQARRDHWAVLGPRREICQLQRGLGNGRTYACRSPDWLEV